MFRYPDKPKLTLGYEGLAQYVLMHAPGTLIAQAKVDGWRCELEVLPDAQARFTSRHNKPLPISPAMTERVSALLRERPIPAGTILDCEWVERRPACRDEMLVVFDVMQIGDEPLWCIELFARLTRLREMLGRESPWLVPMHPDPEVLWRQLRGEPWAEGVVVKALGSTYIGSTRGCADNPAWVRVKWREGEDGMTEVA